MTRRSGFALMIGAALALQTGCWFGTGSTSDIRYEFSHRTGVELEPEFGIKLGRISTGFAKMFVKSHDDDLSFKGVSKIEVGVYEIVDREGPAGSDLAAMERRLRGMEPEPPPSDEKYSDRAKLFAAEIYVALGMRYGPRMEARELGCFASRWTEAELAALPPPMEARLWDHAVRDAAKLRKRRKLHRPGAMFCDIWTALLSKAKAGTLE